MSAAGIDNALPIANVARMVTLDPRIDAYIAEAADYARPILAELRQRVHAACPDVVETIKWRNPSFDYRGLLCGMAAFKRHCAFGFWKHDLVVGKSAAAEAAWGSLGKLTSIADLPPKAAMAKLIKRAMQLNVDGVKAPRAKTAPKAAVKMHPEFQQALGKHARARANFAAFSPSCKREYLSWIAEAKQDATRARRIADAVAWIAEGKHRNWKYMNC